jgi:hypothetical protein
MTHEAIALGKRKVLIARYRIWVDALNNQARGIITPKRSSQAPRLSISASSICSIVRMFFTHNNGFYQ